MPLPDLPTTSGACRIRAEGHEPPALARGLLVQRRHASVDSVVAQESEDWLSASDLHESSVRSATRQSADTDPWLEGEEPVESASGTDLPLPGTTNTSAAAALPPHGGSAPAEPSTESEQPVRQLQAEPGFHSVDKPCLDEPAQSAAGLAGR